MGDFQPHILHFYSKFCDRKKYSARLHLERMVSVIISSLFLKMIMMMRMPNVAEADSVDN